MASHTLSGMSFFAADVLAKNATEYTKYGWISYIVIGGIAGWLAGKFMGTSGQQGILIDVVLGVVGGFLGGFILSSTIWKHSAQGFWFTLISALLGAVILLWIWKKVKK